MAEYSITLNLTGNAVERTERLATALATAATNAATLASHLSAVGAASKSVSAPRNVKGNQGTHAQGTPAPGTAAYYASPGFTTNVTRMGVVATKMKAAADKQEVAATKQNSAANKNARNHSRKGTSEFISSGYGMSFGGFSWRAGQIKSLQLGATATSLLKGVNIAGIATSIVTGIGKAIFSVVSKATIYPRLLNAGIMFGLSKLLMGDFIAQGAALNSRRLMASNVLGEDYERANMQADFLASAYGVDRGTSLGNIAALTGATVEGRKIGIGEASELTRIGALLSKQSGASIEKVLTNLQQLILQVKPNLRDIRELINQAPILSSYAMKRMEDEGKTGDPREALKDRQFLFHTLGDYAIDNRLTPVMHARGAVQSAISDAGAKLADNENWTTIGVAAANLITKIVGALDNLITSVSKNPDFLIALESFGVLFDYLSKNSDWLVGKLQGVAADIQQFAGVNIEEEDAVKSYGRKQTVAKGFADEGIREYAYNLYKSEKGYLFDTEEKMRTAFKSWYSGAETMGLRDKEILESVTAEGPENTTWKVTRTPLMLSLSENPLSLWLMQRDAYIPLEQRRVTDMTNFNKRPDAFTRIVALPDYGEWDRYGAGAYSVSKQPFQEFLLRYMKQDTTGEVTKTDTNKNTTNDDGSYLSGFNRDRRSLEIHFHAPVVEWNSNIQSSTPTGVVEEVRNNIDLLAAAAIQKALLGASQGMNARF